MNGPSRHLSAAEWAMLLLLSTLWGGSFFFTGVALRELEPFTVVLMRVGLAALVLQLIATASGVRVPTDPRTLADFSIMGMLNIVIPFSLIVWGQTQIPSGLASILNATTPLFAAVVAHVLTENEKLTPLRAAGVAAGFAGVVVLVGPAALGQTSAGVLAHLAGVAGAFSYALAGVYGRRFAKAGYKPLAASAATTGVSTLLLAPIAFTFESPLGVLQSSGAVWASLAGMALLSTVAGYLLYYRILATAGATNLMLVTFLMPVTAIVLGWLFLGETLRPGHFMGMVLIACGLALIDGRLIRALRGKS